jgi:hypothetical protein
MLSLVFFIALLPLPEVVRAQTCTPSCDAANGEVCRGGCVPFTAGTLVGAVTQCADETGTNVNCAGTSSYVFAEHQTTVHQSRVFLKFEFL